MSYAFEMLGLRPELVKAVVELGYEQPTPIQAGAIPALLEGRDVLGQAQTGTGKTAAFALPMLNALDVNDKHGVQGLILAPTRELAVQVCEAIYQYGQFRNVRVLPIYGGQSIVRQIKRLERDTQIVVGTPGRILDLIRRGSLDLSKIRHLVLDEADEMLKMGFIEDVEAILKETPKDRQTALFSATLSPEIRRLAGKYMNDPVSVTIESKVRTVAQTEQRYYLVHEESKFAALSRLIETEDINNVLIFVRTRVGAAELAENLNGRGYPAEALHGDLSQDVRETVLRRFRKGQLSILVATDVAARGIDIEEVSHVVNYDMPFDPEDYVHRIGRTGRAGRPGIAIMLVTPRERRRLRDIENFTRQPITKATLPLVEEVYLRREQRFQSVLNTLLLEENLDTELDFVRTLERGGYDLADLAAAAIRMARSSEILRPIEDIREVVDRPERPHRRERVEDHEPRRSERPARRRNGQEPGMVRLQLNMGREHGIRPGDVVGAIASEAGIPGRAIGAIDIQKTRTFVDVKDIHVDNVLERMSRRTLRGKEITLTRASNN
jgi:ATP-dependent RNA helicase DeaD